MATSDNARFLRQWWEVAISHVGLGFSSPQEAVRSRKKWFPYNKGGSFRKWYGNNDLVINWENDGEQVIAYAKQLYGSPSRQIQSQEYYFQSGISWSALSGGAVSMRANGPGFLFDSKGSSMFCEDEDTMFALMAVFNSVVANLLLDVMAPTLDFSAGAMANLPVPADFIRQQKAKIATLSRACCAIARSDWDAAETSIGFTGTPILQTETRGANAEEAFAKWGHLCSTRIQELRKLEAENNQLFIAAYALDGEVSAEVPEQQLTLARADREQDMKRLISYAIGCMMGRYSLDKPGLIYAHSRNEGFDASQYHTFPADADGIIPITELAWFSDDATERFVEFIGKAWPAEHLEGNLKFIADSLGANRDEHPRATIRRYLATGFYKDHLSTYKKRPIYWLFSSGKQKAFQCLVYLHRYHEGTLARMRTEYVIPLQGKLSQRIEQLVGDITAATSTSHRRKLEKERESLVKQRIELAAFDEKLRHYADRRIALDLDDGVKVNYGKFGDLLAEVKAVTGGTEE